MKSWCQVDKNHTNSVIIWVSEINLLILYIGLIATFFLLDGIQEAEGSGTDVKEEASLSRGQEAKPAATITP